VNYRRAAKIYWLTCKHCGWQPAIASKDVMRAQLVAHIRTEHRQQETAR
jgi:hypothetical protein